MKSISIILLITLNLLFSLNGYSQFNRKNNKKSSIYNGTYQPLSTCVAGKRIFEIREGTLWVSGYGYNGNLGTGVSIATLYNFTQVGSASNWISVSAGEYHTYGLQADGTIWSWGRNEKGQLGDGGVATETPSPAQIGTDNDWVAFSAGAYFGIAMKANGTLWAVGDNFQGQLGIGNTTDQNTLTQIGTDNNWASIDAGYSHCLATKSDGSLWVWGSNFGTGMGVLTSPTQIGTAKNWQIINAGDNFNLAVKTDGTLWSWGYNGNGECGLGYNGFVGTPTQVGTDSDWTVISGGVSTSLALKSNGTLWAAGKNSYGQIGNGTNTDTSSFIQIGSDANWVVISAGGGTSYGIKANGELLAWGRGDLGGLANGGFTNTNTPSVVETDSRLKWLSVSSGEHSLAIKSEGSLWGFGKNDFNQLGINSPYYNFYDPIQVGVGYDWISAKAGSWTQFSCAIKANGTLWAWGRNNQGQLGDGTTTDRTAPVQVGAANNWISVDMCQESTIALKANGTLWAWGSNGYGNLGLGNYSSQINPVQIGSDNKWTSVDAGLAHVIALKSDGTLWAWGYNQYGQLGTGNTTTLTSPTMIGTDTNWVSISTSGHHNLALKSNGTLWAWGYNVDGQIGNGTNVVQLTPVQIGSATNWVQVSGGKDHSSALKADGTIMSWGKNASGQLGDGTYVSKNTPTLGDVSNSWISIEGSVVSNLGIKANRSNICGAGSNGQGQLGLGTGVNYATSYICSTNCLTPLAPAVSSASICMNSTATLTVTGSVGTVSWYDAPTGGNYLASGLTFTTPPLTTTTSFYAQDSTSCGATVIRGIGLVTVSGFSSTTSTITTTSCGSYILNSITYDSTNTYTNIIPNAAGCDSIITLNLTVINPINVTDSITLCAGQSLIVGSNTYNVSGTYIDTLIAISGCDSIITSVLFINPSIIVTATLTNNAGCQGDTLGKVNSSVSGGTPNYTYLWNTGATVDSLINLPAGTYTVVVTDSLLCTQSQTVTVTENAFKDLYGAVTFPSGTIDNGLAIAVKLQNSLAGIDTVASFIITPGINSYTFSGLAADNYLIKIIPNPTIHRKAVPTYFGNKFQWDSSYVVNHGCLQTDTANVQVIKLLSGVGTGFISGRVKEGNGFTGLRISNHGHNPDMPFVPGGPLKGIDVKLGKNPGGGIQARTMSDSTGYYHFDSIPDGNYTVYVDIPNLPMDSTRNVTLIAGADTSRNNNYTADSLVIYVDTTQAIGIYSSNKKYENKFSIYPNPAKNDINILFEVTKTTDNIEFEISDIMGRKIYSVTKQSYNLGKNTISLNIEKLNLTEGIYFISIVNENKRFTQRIALLK